ncbi:MAG: lipoprotein [Kangiellaceae bacterium]|nr:lipoprotein [Kangiellaceae bacterium]
MTIIMTRSKLKLLIILFTVSLIAACGQKGDLYLAPSEPQTQAVMDESQDVKAEKEQAVIEDGEVEQEPQ